MKPDSEKEKLPNGITGCSDRELLDLWKSGNESAAELIVDRYATRLIAMIAVKMNRRFQQVDSAEDVVQSAMCSFFVAAEKSRIQISHSVSLWHVLATFAKRKMIRSIEKQSAAKRGGEMKRVTFDELINQQQDGRSLQDSEEMIEAMVASLPKELHPTFELAVAGFSHVEIGARLKITPRTVRRHLVKIRQLLGPSDPGKHEIAFPPTSFRVESLPRISYSEFVLGRMTGSGGFGKVYKAAMQNNNQIVAVKFLRKAFWQDQQAKEMLLREVDQASRIRHPSIAKFLGWGESPQGAPYLTMQWIEGKTLESYRELSASNFAELLRNICKTVDYIHQHGVVHGDLSPLNILIDDSQHWITDFGFSQATRSHSQRLETHTGIRGGTLGFAAPEQISSHWGPIGKATDIYAIGGLAHWYLTGHAPNATNSTASSILQTLDNADYQQQLEDHRFGDNFLIMEVARLALVKDLNKRPVSVQPLIEVLAKTPK